MSSDHAGMVADSESNKRVDIITAFRHLPASDAPSRIRSIQRAKFKVNAVGHNPDVRHGFDCVTKGFIYIFGNDHTLNTLLWPRQMSFYVRHVSEELTNGGIARLASL